MAAVVVDAEASEPITDRRSFDALIQRLSRQSVEKHYDAYADIPWDDPVMAIDPDDSRWELPTLEALSRTEWYREQPPEVRARLGLFRVATCMKIGLQFESFLKRGLLTYAYSLPNGSPEFRYVYHEIAEETHHGMMFQEFVNRTGMKVHGMPAVSNMAGGVGLSVLARVLPELFFFAVLGGEDPIDYSQRRMLRDAKNGTVHPLWETIMRHHVTEEARHLSFARHYLKTRMPELGRLRRAIASVAAPLILWGMAILMLGPYPWVRTRHVKIPPRALHDAFWAKREYRRDIRESIRKPRALCNELGLMNPTSRRVWHLLDRWADAGQRSSQLVAGYPADERRNLADGGAPFG